MILDKRRINKQECDIHVNQSGYFTITLAGSDNTIASGKDLERALASATKLIRRARKMRLWIPFTDMDTFRSKAITGLHAQNGDYLVFDLETEETERHYKYSMHHELRPKDEIPADALEVRIKLEERKQKLKQLQDDTHERINRWNEKYTINVRTQVELAVKEWEEEHSPNA